MAQVTTRRGGRRAVLDDLYAERPTFPSVCLYTPSANPSGMGEHMLDLADEYVRLGGSVTVLCWPTEPGERLLQRAEAVGARAARTPHPRDPGFADAIISHLDSHPVEVFHVHVGTGRENFDGARAARSAGVGAVVQTLHLPWMMTQRRKREALFRSLPDVDQLIAVSQAQRETYERVGVPSSRLITVPNGVRPRSHSWGRAAARERLGLTPDQPVVMTVGRLTVMKGQRYLVEAMPRLLEEFPDLAVVMVGSGHLHQALTSQAADLGVSDSLRLVGHLDDARALLDAADVFTLPSRHEGMPLAVMEAMDAGLPVVGTRVIGTAEIIEPGVTGELVAPQDARSLGDALARVLRDPDLRAAQGRAGRRRYLECFTADRMAADTVAVYEHTLRAVSTTTRAVGGRR